MPAVLDKLSSLGIQLPEAPKAVANYLPAVIADIESRLSAGRRP